MKFAKFLFAGILFGFILTKSELISWYRWQEMFRFESFRLFGIMFSSVAFGALGIALIKKFNIPDIHGHPIVFVDKKKRFYRYAIGGFIFGLGWAMASCPGAHYAMIGHGYVMFVLVLLSAVLGTYTYGLLQRWLPH